MLRFDDDYNYDTFVDSQKNLPLCERVFFEHPDHEFHHDLEWLLAERAEFFFFDEEVRGILDFPFEGLN